jgi:hypothetical protein
MPFFEVRVSYMWRDGSTTFSYFFNSVNKSIYIGDPFSPFASLELLWVSGWIMILLGTLVLCAFAWVFYRENRSLKPYHFPPLRWFSILSVVSFLFEWILIIIIMTLEPWRDYLYLHTRIFHPPALNLPLFGLMLLGQICLVLVNNLGRLNN